MRVPPTLLRFAASYLGPLVIKGWLGSVRVHTPVRQPPGDPFEGLPLDRPYLFCTWHEDLLIPLYRYGRFGFSVLISPSDDGEYVTRICEGLGWKVIRGSSNQRARGAVRDLLAPEILEPERQLAITVDGPRGPRRSFQPGAVFLSSRLGRPIIPVGFAYDEPRRAKSWDRFVLPRLWRPAAMTLGEPIEVPPGLEREEIADYAERCRLAMLDANQMAQNHLETILGRPGEQPSAWQSLPPKVRKRKSA